MQYRIILSVVTIVLTFIGYAPYFRDILKKKTTPHVFTWFILTLAGFITYGLQVVGGGGVGSWSLLAATLIAFVFFLYALKAGKKNITLSDIFFLLLALVALFMWLVVKQPVWSVILITSAEILGFVPTVRKSWNQPYSETLSTYEIFIVRLGLSVFALEKINILTALYPIAWTAVNIFFSIFLIIRRKQLAKY